MLLKSAAIPDSNGVINGCYQKNVGNLRVIDPSAGDSCRPSEIAISWSQTGPQGPAGPVGPQQAEGRHRRDRSAGAEGRHRRDRRDRRDWRDRRDRRAGSGWTDGCGRSEFVVSGGMT